MTAEFVPAVDRHHSLWWLDPQGDVRATDNNPDNVEAAERANWHRLGWMQTVETPPFDHSDMCEDGDDDMPHLPDGTCACWCPKCNDADFYCICPMCSRLSKHDHRPVTT
jgi:hypothetical protein